jgi:hypothetical protein
MTCLSTEDDRSGGGRFFEINTKILSKKPVYKKLDSPKPKNSQRHSALILTPHIPVLTTKLWKLQFKFAKMTPDHLFKLSSWDVWGLKMAITDICFLRKHT